MTNEGEEYREVETAGKVGTSVDSEGEDDKDTDILFFHK